MPGQQELLQIIDREGFHSEIEFGMTEVRRFDEYIKTFSGLSLFGKNINGAADFRKQSVEFAAALEKIKVLTNQLIELEAKLAAAKEKTGKVGKAQTDEDVRNALRVQSARKQQIDSIKAEDNAYTQLRQKVAAANAEYRKLSAEYGINSKQAKEAREQAMAYGNQLNKINESIGSHQHNVGNYFQGIKEFGNEIARQALMFIGIYQAFEFFKDSVKEFQHAQQEASKLNNILTNLGRKDALAGLNTEAAKLAEEFKTIKVEDVTGVFDQLIVYGKLTENQIKQLTPVIINFAAQTGKSMEEATSIILKGLEGNARGLKEFGINMKDGKDVAERFGLVMSELAPRVAGAAKAFGETTAGEIKKTEVEIDELKKSIGGDLQPAIRGFLDIISGALTGIKKAAKEVGEYFDEFIDKAKTLYLAAKGAFTANFSDLTAYNASKRAQLLHLKDIEEINEANRRAGSVAEDASHKSIDAQQKLYLSYVATARASRDVYASLKASGTATAAQLHQAALMLIEDAKTVDLFQKNIAAAKDKRVLGFGEDPKKAKDTGEDDAVNREIAAHAKLIALLREEDIEMQKIILANKDIQPKFRSEAADKIFDIQKKSIEEIRDVELKNTKLTESGRAYIIEKAEDDIYKARVEMDLSILKVHAEALQREKEDEKMTVDEMLAMRARYYKAKEDLANASNIRTKAYINEARDYELLALEKARVAGTVSPEDYEKKKSNISDNATAFDLKADQDKVASEVALAKEKGDSTVTLEAQYANLELEIYKAKNRAKEADDARNLTNKKKLQDDELKAAEAVASTVESFIKDGYEKQINAIQKQIDLNNKGKEQEVRDIKNSSLSAQEKAARQIELDAEVNAQNEALQRRQRQLKRKEAEADKAFAIAQIIEQTAIAVIAALKIPIYGEAEAIAIGIIGAANLAKVAAAPIPQYATGIDYKPTSGPMIVGEKGPELMITPDGKASMTPGTPTLTYGEMGTKIIPANVVNDMLLRDIFKHTAVQIQQKQQDNTEIIDAIKSASQAQINAIKKVKPPTVVLHNNTAFIELKNRMI